LIDYDFTRQRYFNIGRAHSHGLELSLRRSLRAFELRDTLTTIQAKDEVTGMKLLRRPALMNTFELSYEKGERLGATLLGRYVGRRDDLHPSLFTRQEMPPFFTLGWDGFYRLGEGKIFARAENLLDRHYQETSGFGTAGRSFYLGIEGSL
jgi:vitamin B12 transporter